jgi:hypothetical protein
MPSSRQAAIHDRRRIVRGAQRVVERDQERVADLGPPPIRDVDEGADRAARRPCSSSSGARVLEQAGRCGRRRARCRARRRLTAATVARRHLQRQLLAGTLAAVHVEEPEARRTLAVRRGHRGVLAGAEAQRRGERRVHLDRAALGVERDADADGDHGEQRLELGHAIAQLAVRPRQALFAGAADAGELQRGADARDQLAAPNGLHHDSRRRRPRVRRRRASSPARAETRDHGQVPQRAIGADRPQQLQAVEARHHHVGEQQIGRLAPHRGERGHAVADRLDAAGRREQAGHVVAHVGVVVGDDDARPRRPVRRPAPLGAAGRQPA